MRRTLALAGVAVLGVTGLAGPASADAGIAHHSAVYFSEIGAELDSATTPQSFDGGFLEIENNTTSTINIGGWQFIGCTAVDEFDTISVVAGFQLNPGETYLVGDPNFTGAGTSEPNASFAAGEVLLQADGGALLLDGADGFVDEIAWGNSTASCASTVVADVSPTDGQTANHPAALNDPWFHASPSPMKGDPAA